MARAERAEFHRKLEAMVKAEEDAVEAFTLYSKSAGVSDTTVMVPLGVLARCRVEFHKLQSHPRRVMEETLARKNIPIPDIFSAKYAGLNRELTSSLRDFYYKVYATEYEQWLKSHPDS